MFRSTTEHAGLRLEVIVPPEPTMAKVDVGMWSTIVTNLVANAVKFTAAGTVTVRLAVTADDVVLTIADTGVGIAADEHSRVFDRFYQAPRVESLGGEGIGLALVSDLVRAHDGTIELASTEGRGSTFTVTIPRVPADGIPAKDVGYPAGIEPAGVDPAGIEPAGVDPAGIEPAGIEPAGVDPAGVDPAGVGTLPRQTVTGSKITRAARHPVAGLRAVAPGASNDPTNGAAATAPARPRVLLVEDDADLCVYLARVLTEDGWQVTAVGDAEAASAALCTESADAATDLVLTDVMLPGRTGLELLTGLRANESTARLPIVVLTARAARPPRRRTGRRRRRLSDQAVRDTGAAGNGPGRTTS